MVGTTRWFIQLFLNLLNLKKCSAFGKSWNKLNILKSNNQINSTVTNRAWVLSTYWTRSRSSAGLLCEWKNDGSPCLLERSILFWRMRGCWIILTKMAVSLSALAFRRHVVNAIFLKYSKEGSNIWIRNVPLDVCYNDTKIFRSHLKNKAGVRCAERTPNADA